MTFIFILGIAY